MDKKTFCKYIEELKKLTLKSKEVEKKYEQ